MTPMIPKTNRVGSRRIRIKWAGICALAVAVLAVAGTQAQADPKDLGPLPKVKKQNPAAVELGKLLFFDNRISGDADIKCSQCHIPEKGWADGKELSTGYPSTEYFRNAKTVMNAVHATYFYWDGRLDGADMPTQVRDIITESHFHAADGRIMAQRLKNIPEYVDLFKKAFGSEPSFGTILKSVSAFERTLVSKNVPFDKFITGDKGAISAKAKQGLELFKGKAGCIQCHSGPYFSDSEAHNLGVPENARIFLEAKRHITFRSMLSFLGVPNYHNLRRDPGFFAITKDYKDMGKFVTPTLREVSRTGPYMHNGVIKTLAGVVDFYNGGGGKDPLKDKRIKPLGLSGAEKSALVAFLESLSGDPIIIKITKKDLPKYKAIPNWYKVAN